MTSLIIAHYQSSVEHQGRVRLGLLDYGSLVVPQSYMYPTLLQSVPAGQNSEGRYKNRRWQISQRMGYSLRHPFVIVQLITLAPGMSRRAVVKSRGMESTCLASRAVHLEVANSLTADLFINAYHRFIGQRGPVHQISSDKGTNLVEPEMSFTSPSQSKTTTKSDRSF